jgi:hypothetical protein
VIRRLKAWTISWLIAFDHLAFVWLAGWAYVWFGRGPCPDPDQSISACIGHRAGEGRRWAVLCLWLIDQLFGSGHCLKAWTRYAAMLAAIEAANRGEPTA